MKTYKELRKELKAEYIKLFTTHTAFKRTHRLSNISPYYNEVRIKHIAYSMFKGNSFESIEHSWKDERNPLNEYIKAKAFALYESYKAQVDTVAQDAVNIEV